MSTVTPGIYRHDKLQRHATLCFLVKEEQGRITNICLAMKKRGFGAGRWNGAGGKVETGENIEAAMLRETAEEINVVPTTYHKVAELTFIFAEQPELNQLVHVFLVTGWQGEPTESDEMRPRWFASDRLPFADMWPDDVLWLPQVLAGERLEAAFVFGSRDVIVAHRVASISLPAPAEC